MAPRLLGQTSPFGVVFFVFKSLLGTERQRKIYKVTLFTRTPRSHVRILMFERDLLCNILLLKVKFAIVR